MSFTRKCLAKWVLITDIKHIPDWCLFQELRVQGNSMPFPCTLQSTHVAGGSCLLTFILLANPAIASLINHSPIFNLHYINQLIVPICWWFYFLWVDIHDVFYRQEMALANCGHSDFSAAYCLFGKAGSMAICFESVLSSSKLVESHRVDPLMLIGENTHTAFWCYLGW